MGRPVAIKVLHASCGLDAARIERFWEEGRIASQLEHPAIVPVYDLGLDAEERPFFTMKLVEGRTLAKLLAERASPKDDLARLLTIFQQVCNAVAFAHDRGVVHRDLKPGNVFLTESDEGFLNGVDLALVGLAGGPDAPVVVDVTEQGVEIRSGSAQTVCRRPC